MHERYIDLEGLRAKELAKKREMLAGHQQQLKTTVPEECQKRKVWRYVNKHGDGNLSIKMRSAKAPIELRNLTEQLKSKISQVDFSDGNKSTVLNPIKSLLGVSGDSETWRYLNKGTHEEKDRAEFDRQTVNKIVTALEQIDAALK